MILTEIKKGQVGTGLLIENDGYVSLDMPENKIITEAFGIDGVGHIKPKDLPDPFVVSAVFQKFGIENANGVSSRGLGSVEKQFNKLIVGDDYEIVCWDVVAQPSTPQAYIGLDDRELEPYIESKKESKPIIKENKLEKFDKWLLK